MADDNHEAWWQSTTRLARLVVGLALLALVLAGMAPAFDTGDFLGFPLGHFLGAILLPVLLTILVFRFSRRQGRIDSRHGFSED